MLFPETRHALSYKALGILSGEIKIPGTWLWSAKFFDEFLVSPKKGKQDEVKDHYPYIRNGS